MSAAKAEPVMANTAATSTIFFIGNPNAFSRSVRIWRLRNTGRQPTGTKFINPRGNLVWVAGCVKQKK
jgi:hypothetical protein